MNRVILSVLMAGVALAVGLPGVVAQDKPKAAPGAVAAEKKKSGALPFNGKLTAVDPAAKTITLSGKEARVMQVTEMTKITKGGQAATLADAKVGDEAGGSYRKSDAGKLELVSLRIGPRPETAKKQEKK